MLEDKLNGFERSKLAGKRIVSRIAMYSAGLIFSFGTLAQEQCEYVSQRYAVDGTKAVMAATALYAASCGGEESECCEKLDCGRLNGGLDTYYCEDDPRESQRGSGSCPEDSNGHEDCCACVKQYNSNDE